MPILCTLAQLYMLALFVRIVLSWFPISPGGAMASIFSFLYSITEPVLGPVRRMLPPVGRDSPSSIRMVVVFPEPFGPRKPCTPPAGTARSRSRTATRTAPARV